MPASPARAASTAAFNARMFVWNAISSITLMILEILSLELLISPMAPTMFSSERLAWTNFCCDCVTRPAAAVEFSVFLRAMELISSLEAEVSSSEAACSEEPCASTWADEAICDAALATCSALPPTSEARRRRAPLTWRTTASTSPPTARHTPIRMKAIQRPREETASASWAAALRRLLCDSSNTSPAFCICAAMVTVRSIELTIAASNC